MVNEHLIKFLVCLFPAILFALGWVYIEVTHGTKTALAVLAMIVSMMLMGWVVSVW